MTQKRSKNGVTQLAQTTIDSNSDSYIENQENPSLSTNPSKRSSLKGFFNLTGTDTAMTHNITLLDCGGDLTKSWRISFYIYSNAQKKVIKKFMRVPAKFKTDQARRNWADQAIEKLKMEITKGKTLDDVPEPVIVPKRILVFEGAIIEAIEFKKRQTQKSDTKSTYNFYLRNLMDWGIENNFLERNIEDFATEHAFSLIRKMDVGIGAKTYNNYLSFFKAIFNTLIDQEIINKNPFKSIKKKKEIEPPNVPYNEAQKKKILFALNELENPLQLLYVKFMYYTLMRPVEVTKIKAFHVHAEKILVPGADSKTKSSDYVVITPGLKALLSQMKVENMPRNAYLFGRDGIGTQIQMASNYVSRIHTPILRALGFEDIFTLYSWKDTGACDLYNATKDIIFVSRQCRHSSIDMTMTYLRSMGLLNDMLNASKAPILPI